MAARVVVVGGGFTGASAAVQLARRTPFPLEIAVVEPRERVGPGLAYSAEDPDHRINGTIDSHFVDAQDPGEGRRWCEATGVLARDPEALAPNGAYYVRRRDFGAFVADAFARTGAAHVRDVATAIAPAGRGFAVATAASGTLRADLVVVATGNATRAPWALDPARLAAIPPDARVLLVGSGLTALDVLSTLVRRGHRGAITAMSRHGIRPRPQRTPPQPASVPRPIPGMHRDVPAFVEALGESPTMLQLSRALRGRIAQVAARGGEWQEAFDELRDVVWLVWPRLAVSEKRRFLRLLRPWYDAHRFRTPPQNVALVAAAERSGQVRHVVGRSRPPGAFDVVIDCTGLDPAYGARDNPLLASMLRDGMLARDATGLGFAVDDECRPCDAAGRPQPRLRLFGPPTAGARGDPLGVLFIAPQVHRAMGAMLAELA